MALILTPVNQVSPGQRFIQYGQTYRRAREEEIAGHMCKDMLAKQPDLVLAYMLTPKEKMPISFQPTEAVNIKAKRLDQ